MILLFSLFEQPYSNVWLLLYPTKYNDLIPLLPQ